MAQHVAAYLKGTKSAHLHFKKSKSPLKIEGYTNADWGSDHNDCKSTTRYTFLVNGCPVSWSSKQQVTVALFSTKAKYMSVTQVTKEAIWLRRLFADMGHPQKGATVIHEDNHRCIGLTKNPIHHAQTKHINIQHHFVQEHVESGEVVLKEIPTAQQLADVLTKALTKDKFNALADKLVKGLF